MLSFTLIRQPLIRNSALSLAVFLGDEQLPQAEHKACDCALCVHKCRLEELSASTLRVTEWFFGTSISLKMYENLHD